MDTHTPRALHARNVRRRESGVMERGVQAMATYNAGYVETVDIASQKTTKTGPGNLLNH